MSNYECYDGRRNVDMEQVEKIEQRINLVSDNDRKVIWLKDLLDAVLSDNVVFFQQLGKEVQDYYRKNVDKEIQK